MSRVEASAEALRQMEQERLDENKG
jgi:hypothetical protein